MAKSLSDPGFTKYRDLGAYHWSFTYGGSWLRYSPRSHAIYDVPIRLLGKHLDLFADYQGLDIGCGDGIMLYKAIRSGRRVIGVDLRHEALVLANEQIVKRVSKKPETLNASCYELPLGDHTIDYATSIEVIEHLASPHRYLSEIRRVLTSRGVLALTTPNRTRTGAVKDPFHVCEYTGEELSALLKEYFRQVSVWGMHPANLDRLYFSPTRWGSLNKSIRLAFKSFARLVINPYSYRLTSAPTPNWSNLVALCSNAS